MALFLFFPAPQVLADLLLWVCCAFALTQFSPSGRDSGVSAHLALGGHGQIAQQQRQQHGGHGGLGQIAQQQGQQHGGHGGLGQSAQQQGQQHSSSPHGGANGCALHGHHHPPAFEQGEKKRVRYVPYPYHRCISFPWAVCHCAVVSKTVLYFPLAL